MEIAGELRWLVCHDVCIPQRAELTAPVRIGNASTDSVARARLNVAAERMPTPLPANFRASATSAPGNFQVALSSNQQIAQAEFFPAEPGQIDNAAAQKVSIHAGVTTLELKKSDQLQRAPERLQGVLVFNQQESYELDVPIQEWVAQKRRRQ